jgi:Fe-S cluster assembly protein SufD
MTEVTPIRTKVESALLVRFPAVKAALPGNASIAHLRDDAFAAFEQTGLPHRRIEAWHYTDLRNLLRDAPELAAKPQSHVIQRAAEHASPLDQVAATRLVMVNGFYDANISTFGLPQGVEVKDMHKALGDADLVLGEHLGAATTTPDPLISLNTAFMNGGLILSIAANTKLDQPIELRFITETIDAIAMHPRVLVIVGEGAEVTLIESHQGPDGLAYQTNAVVEIFGGNGAKIEHLRLSNGGNHAIDLSTLAINLEENAAFHTLNFVTKPGLARHQVFACLKGEGIALDVDGVSLLSGTQHVDTTLAIDHAAPGCASRELFKTVLDAQSTGVFQGRIMVKQIAQQTDGKMMSQAVLLSDDARMNNKPELEIFADDVVCGHGATCGALDDDLLFYLMARGLPRIEAEALMLAAFVGEAFEKIAHDGVREVFETLAETWLKGRSTAKGQH